MTRSKTPEQSLSHPVLLCALQDPGCVKINGDGSGKMTLTFDASQVDVAAELAKHYREQEVHVVFIRRGRTGQRVEAELT